MEKGALQRDQHRFIGTFYTGDRKKWERWMFLQLKINKKESAPFEILLVFPSPLFFFMFYFTFKQPIKPGECNTVFIGIFIRVERNYFHKLWWVLTRRNSCEMFEVQIANQADFPPRFSSIDRNTTRVSCLCFANKSKSNWILQYICSQIAVIHSPHSPRRRLEKDRNVSWPSESEW